MVSWPYAIDKLSGFQSIFGEQVIPNLKGLAAHQFQSSAAVGFER